MAGGREITDWRAPRKAYNDALVRVATAAAKRAAMQKIITLADIR